MEWETWSVHDLDTGIDDLADKLKYTGWHDILPARSSCRSGAEIPMVSAMDFVFSPEPY